MHTPPPHQSHALPRDPPAIVEEVKIAKAVRDEVKSVIDAEDEKENLSRELRSATARGNEEAARPVDDRRVERDRSRTKRSR